MSALVELTQFGARTNSRVVAEVFEKEHKNVLAAIDDIVAKKPELRGLNFQPTEETLHLGAAPRTIRFYEMDRDGFTLVAMGFTGAKALDWKLAFIDAFNRMEAALRAEDDEAREGEPLVMRDYSPALAVIREARQIFPPKAVRQLWPRLGLPSPFGRTLSLLADAGADGPVFESSVVAWRDACTVDDPDAETPANQLWESYQAWCEETGRSGVNQTRFGRGLSMLSYLPARGGQGYVKRIGIKLVG